MQTSIPPIVIQLPRRLGMMEMLELQAHWPSPSCSAAIQIRLHPEQWIEPAGMVGLACLIEVIRLRGNPISVDHSDCSRAGYWERMGFFREVGLNGPNPSGVPQSSRRRFSEIRRISDIWDVDKITDELVEITSPDESCHRTLSHIYSELMNNVCQHSQSCGFTCAQYWPATSNVQFCIGDYGIGLQSALETRYRPNDSLTAIKLAMDVGVTSNPPQIGQPHMRNRGVGLSCAYRLVTANGGRFNVWSGDGFFCSQTGERIVNRWTGTLITLTMNRESLTADFAAVMNQLIAELKLVERARSRR
jgi:hypothetical protein